MAFADLVANLNLNITNFSSNLSRASRQMNNFARNMQDNYSLAASALNKHNLQLKDTVRIVHGIVVAQTFYQAAGAITDATRSLWNFNVALDYMNVTYSALFGSTKVASDFMAVLQEHSVETIFDYQNLADASKKLLAYGIEYENLMFIMEGLTNLGAMSGDSAALDRIALALGQIYTKGKLSAEEMRQLANAYIPITEILQDKFGLTGDDLKRVGDLNLPAADVINAIVDYANENFGSVGDAAMYTITGLQNRIVDTLKVVGAQMLKPITTAYKSFLAYMSSGLEALRAEFEAGGVGGIFEYLVPDPDTQQTIRQFIANVRNLFMSLVSVGVVVGQVFGNFASVFVTAFNIVSPIIVGFVNVLASLLNALLSTRTGATLLRVALVAAAGAFVILKVQAVAALVITAVTKAVINLAKALFLLASLITKHPILALLAGLAITLVGVSSASNSANKSISSLFDTLSGAGGGASSGDVLQKVEQDLVDSTGAADQFNNRLDGATNAADELANAIGGAGNAADKAAKKTGGLLSFDEVYKLPEPTEPKDTSGGSGVGSGILDDIGNIMEGLGGLGGALIPDIPDFSEYVSDFTDGLFGGLEDSIMDKIKTTGIGALIGGGIGAIIGGIMGGPPGAVLGAKIGAFAGGLSGLLWTYLESKFEGADADTASVGQAIGTAIGAVIGGLLGGPPGAIIGAAIGTFAGGFVGLFWNPIKKYFDPKHNVLSAFFVQVGKDIASWAIESINDLSDWWDDTKSGFTTWCSDTLEEFSTWWEDTTTGLSDWWDETVAIFSDWDNINGETLSNWWNKTKNGFISWKSDTTGKIDSWKSDTARKFTTWFSDTSRGFMNWVSDTKAKVDGWKSDLINIIKGWASEALKPITDWISDTKAKFTTWKSEVGTVIEGFKIAAKESVSSAMSSMLTSITTKLNEIKSNWTTKWNEIKSSFGSWWSGLGESTRGWLNSYIWNPIANFFNVDNFWNRIKSLLDGIKRKVKTWWEGITDIFDDDKNTNVTVSTNYNRNAPAGYAMAGHASGGVFNREHVARFAEGNRAEAIIPLENNTAMQPFVDAVANGLTGTLAPLIASVNSNNANSLPPMYVGTLIADERGLKQLYRKFELISLQENERRGLSTT